jgi:hypothetical protein
MNQWYKNKMFLGALVVLLIGGFFLFGRSDDNGSDNREDDEMELSENEVSVNGTIECLPYKAATAGQGCVKGVKGDDGKMYALNSITLSGIENTMNEGQKVTAVGEFEPANTSVDDSSVFRYDGVLVLSSLKKR